MDEIRQVLQEARVAILDATDNWPNDACLALEARLDFRQAFLMALEVAELRASPDALRVPWAQMAASLKRIKGSHSLGIAVPESFNTKMQSLLASTMPPRPIVQPSFDETIQKWSLFAEDGAEAVGILNYEDSQSLLVCFFHLGTHVYRLTCIPRTEFRPHLPGQEATTSRVHPVSSTGLHIHRQRYARTA